ncbi:MAG: ribosome silencing factor [Bacteroidales bacterium]|jgi:ribosome-associated protein|nr:MAG: ribosome silencing factor [Paludibacter sp.]MCE1155411.1 ribosome silencing factor [Bacteroidales bacterium]
MVKKRTKDIENEQIVKNIVEGIQERKGKEIVVVNMNRLKEAPCSYFVICEGDSNIHVNAVALSIKEYVQEKMAVKPYAADGFENAEWIAMDYGSIIVHVFQRHARQYYDIEHLWADADLQKIENLN